VITYSLPGSRQHQEALYPNPALLDPAANLTTYEDVIAHMTASSLEQDGILIRESSLEITKGPAGQSGYRIAFDPLPQFVDQAQQFASIHQIMLDEDHAGLALAGADVCRATPAWNPMAGYPVNGSDGPSEWLPCLPLGMPFVNHRAVTLLHYPPIVAYRSADYLNNNTLKRWRQLLQCAGIGQPNRYNAILDVNPIAAPGSGESEYANDYFPISLTSQFFDNEPAGLTYVRAMLELMLNPPANAANPYTLPLLVCGSPLYDPQAPGWFRTRYKDHLQKDKNGSPIADVLTVGLVKIWPDSPKLTPYMIANHMVAAGVTGRCTDEPTRIPNIQKYEAQDLVAVTFLHVLAEAAAQGRPIDQVKAKEEACLRWFGEADGGGAANPPDNDDRIAVCAMAQMDMCFDFKKRAPMFTFEQAKARCLQMNYPGYSPCFGCGDLPPPPRAPSMPCC
jgi:hypothetical protein